jgi:riboflavin kinase/FMN adenylyltransferase
VEILRDPVVCPTPAAGTVVTIGAYDGVHRGHATVIARVRSMAEERGMATAVVTFDRHPASVVRPESAPLLLTDLDQKLELLAATGVDYTRVIHFDEARSREPAEDFVREDLVACLRARLVVVGEDFHFGHRRSGNVELLRRMGAELGFDVAPVELVGPDGQPSIDTATRVSSTRVRTLLRAGELAVANSLLGRPHEVRGTVGGGDKRARELGFPTANINVPDEVCLPRDGIYAAWYLRPDGVPRAAAVSLGRRPTFYDDQPYSLLEAHLLDFSDDLYGESTRVQFVARLRDELRFDSVADLVAQMRRDCDQARRVLVG